MALLLCLLAGSIPAWAARPATLLAKPPAWFNSAEGRQAISNLLSWQSHRGSWPKNMDTTLAPNPANRSKLSGTFDNGATLGELRLLARAINAGAGHACQSAFLLGLNHILEAQYPNGGWPQSYPPGKGYPRYITFNDNTMVALTRFMREVANDKTYAFVDQKTRSRCQAAFEHAVQCILKCQVTIAGELTVWCAQHDEVTLEPRGARSYELPSLSGAESAEVLKFLMTLDKPSPAVCRAIDSGAAWFRSHKITGLRLERRNGERLAVADPAAAPLWARFYDLESGKPFYCDRDGIKKSDYNEVGRERRNGYSWLGTWGNEVEAAYQAWLKTNKP